MEAKKEIELSDIAKHEIENYDFDNQRFILSDRILYSMVKKYRENRNKDEIVAKLIIIGRTYSAALDRVKEKNMKVDYYKVAEEIINKGISDDIDKLKNKRKINNDVLKQVVILHKKLVDIFKEETKIEKRSLASKYLHFHLPKLVFIYDSNVISVINKFVKDRLCLKNELLENINFEKDDKYDEEYLKFYIKALAIHNELYKCKDERFKNGSETLPRYVDRILLRYYEKGQKQEDSNV